jgi:hypothetical protein
MFKLMRFNNFKLQKLNDEFILKKLNNIHRNIFFQYMDEHNDHNILYVQHNHIVDIENLYKQNPFEIILYLIKFDCVFTKEYLHKLNRMLEF